MVGKQKFQNLGIPVIKKLIFFFTTFATISMSAVFAETLSYFFRVLSDQQTSITSFNSNSSIAWTNSVPNSTCRVQWARSPGGPWFETYFANPFSCSGSTGSAPMSSSFKNNSVNTIFRKACSFGFSQIDINQDGIPELSFSNPSGFDIQVTTLGNTKIDSTPRNAGYLINTINASMSGSAIELYGALFIKGAWQNTSSGFMPVVFEKDGNQYCGYVEIELWNSGYMFMPELRIWSYGYDREPARPISAGARP